jgi:hypothetical protein
MGFAMSFRMLYAVCLGLPNLHQGAALCHAAPPEPSDDDDT